VPSIKRAVKSDPYNADQSIYNAIFTNNEVSQNWLNGVPNSLFYSLSNIDWNLSITTVENNLPSPVWETWSIIFGAYTGFLQITGDFPRFTQVVSDVNNNWLNDNTYRVPYAGLYTVSLQIIVISTGLVGPDKAVYSAIQHYNSNDELIKIYDWTNTPEPIVTGTGTLVTNRVAFIIANEGDLIRPNVYGQSLNPSNTLPFAIQPSLGDDKTEMFIQGQPLINPGEIEPVDPCDFRGYLYDFEYPLTMADIQSIVQRPSAPVKFSRTGTINAGIEGTINQLNINSVIKQQGQFTIRSNEKL
jgi:hypothetical protein